MKRDIQILTGQVLAADCRKTIAQATPRELYNAVSKAALDLAADAWKRAPGKRVAYLSAEFLVGRLVYANLLNMAAWARCSRCCWTRVWMRTCLKRSRTRRWATAAWPPGRVLFGFRRHAGRAAGRLRHPVPVRPVQAVF
jgi:hypothetical protein